MALDVAVVGFPKHNGAANAFSERALDGAPWTNEVAFVEHHRNGRIALHGVFDGHYLDIDEEDRVSQPGAAEGALTGLLLGLAFGPAGWASGFVLGGVVGAEAGRPTDVEAKPRKLVDDLRAAVPLGGSAIVLLAAPEHVDAMLAALDEAGGSVVRRTLDDHQVNALEAALAAAPPARIGPIGPGEESRP
jgi:uncharacterized membrane protein